MGLKSLLPLFGKSVLLLTHSGADIDSFGSAAAIHFSLKGRARTTICVPDHLNAGAKALAQNLSIPFKIAGPFDGYDALVCLDFNEPQMLGPLTLQFGDFKGEKFLVDHHRELKTRIASPKNSLVSKGAVSTTELVYGLLKGSNLKIPKKALACIAAGIISDSSSFMVADHNTFSIMAKVMQSARMPYREITRLMKSDMDISQKIASLKAAKRSRIFKSADYIIAVSDVGAFEADSAAALVRIGADAAFCGFAEDGLVRVSGRANSNFLAKTGLDLARDVFSRLGNFFDGQGGGHRGAAGFNGKGESAEPVLLKCAQLLHEAHIGKSGNLKEYA